MSEPQGAGALALGLHPPDAQKTLSENKMRPDRLLGIRLGFCCSARAPVIPMLSRFVQAPIIIISEACFVLKFRRKLRRGVFTQMGEHGGFAAAESSWNQL